MLREHGTIFKYKYKYQTRYAGLHCQIGMISFFRSISIYHRGFYASNLNRPLLSQQIHSTLEFD